MDSFFRKVPVKDRLPELEKYVTTIDTANEQRVYKRIKESAFKEGWYWTLREPDGNESPSNNLPITHWLEEVYLSAESLNDLFLKTLRECEPNYAGASINTRGLIRTGFDLAISKIIATGENLNQLNFNKKNHN